MSGKMAPGSLAEWVKSLVRKVASVAPDFQQTRTQAERGQPIDATTMDLTAMTSQAGADVGTHLFKPLALLSMFARPTYLEASAWIEHIPFAFWLTEAIQPRVMVELGTHRGTSYFVNSPAE